MTPDQRLALGQRAQALLAEPMIADALDKLEDIYVDAWKRTGDSDEAARERAWRGWKAIEQFRRHFCEMIDSGKLAADEMKRRQSSA